MSEWFEVIDREMDELNLCLPVLKHSLYYICAALIPEN